MRDSKRALPALIVERVEAIEVADEMEMLEADADAGGDRLRVIGDLQ